MADDKEKVSDEEKTAAADVTSDVAADAPADEPPAPGGGSTEGPGK